MLVSRDGQVITKLCFLDVSRDFPAIIFFPYNKQITLILYILYFLRILYFLNL